MDPDYSWRGEDYIDFCARANLKKDPLKRSKGQRKLVGEVVAKKEDISLRYYNHALTKYDIVSNLRPVTAQTEPYNIDKEPPEYIVKKNNPRKIDIKLLKKNQNTYIRERLAILKEKSKQDYFLDLHDIQDQYENCDDTDEMERLIRNLQSDYKEIRSFLESTYSSIGGKIKIKYPSDPTPRRKFSYDQVSSRQGEYEPSELSMSSFENRCKKRPTSTRTNYHDISYGQSQHEPSELSVSSFENRCKKRPTNTRTNYHDISYGQGQHEPSELSMSSFEQKCQKRPTSTRRNYKS